MILLWWRRQQQLIIFMLLSPTVNRCVPRRCVMTAGDTDAWLGDASTSFIEKEEDLLWKMISSWIDHCISWRIQPSARRKARRSSANQQPPTTGSSRILPNESIYMFIINYSSYCYFYCNWSFSRIAFFLALLQYPCFPFSSNSFIKKSFKNFWRCCRKDFRRTTGVNLNKKVAGISSNSSINTLQWEYCRLWKLHFVVFDEIVKHFDEIV